ncbi:MAG: FecR domain-containing protein [Anaeromyxobacter sp.]|nr:FecR domain-containing protein [Anaeromyxobacter sp.]MBL0274879.1 FecR domain-containing protein [Anaeromyxobacter sp.]
MTCRSSAPREEILAEAARWEARRHAEEPLSEVEELALAAWSATSPEHRQLLRRAEQVWELSGRVVPRGALEAARATRPASPLGGSLAALRRSPGGWRGLAACGLVACVLAGAAWLWSRPRPPEVHAYRTERGQGHQVRLADGSLVELDTGTALLVRTSPNLRQVVLEHGQASFTVTHDAERPFEVVAGGGRIVDLGTRFLVRADGAQVAVTVAEGLVEVTAPDGQRAALRPGQRLRYGPSGQEGGVEPADAEAAGAWRHGRLIFEDRPVSWLFAELERYHPITFEVPDPGLAATRLSGRFELRDVGAVLSAVQAVTRARARWLDPHRVRLEPR